MAVRCSHAEAQSALVCYQRNLIIDWTPDNCGDDLMYSPIHILPDDKQLEHSHYC